VAGPVLTPYQRVTAAKCAGFAASMRASLEAFGIAPNPLSDIARMIDEMAWLGSFPPDSLQPDVAYAADATRSLKAFTLIEQAQRMSEILTWAQQIPGSRDPVAKLRSRSNRMVDQDAKALDFLFELDIAYRLTIRGSDVAFEEPDLVIRWNGFKFGLACKRPRNVQQMRKCIRKAAKQIAAQPYPGFIVIGLEAMLHISGDPVKRTVVYHVPTPGDLALMVDPQIDEWVRRGEPEILKSFAEGVWGILFCGLATGVADSISQGFGGPIYEWFRRARSNPEFPDSAELLEQGIFRGLDTPVTLPASELVPSTA